MGFRRVVLADGAVRMRARCVEVTQRREAPLIRLRIIRQGALDGKLAGPIRIDRHLRRRFGVAPAVTGYIIEWTGSYAGAFVLTGAIAILGALSVAVFVRSPAWAGAPVLMPDHLARAASPRSTWTCPASR